MEKRYAQVIVSLNTPEVDRIFDYSVPSDMAGYICCGMRVIVPFGNKNNKIEGYVVGFSETSEIEDKKIKPIIEVVDSFPLFTDEMLMLAKWMKEKYFTTLSKCLQTIMPSGINVKSKWFVKISNKAEVYGLTFEEKSIFDYVYKFKIVEKNEITNVFGVKSDSILTSLIKKGAVSTFQKMEVNSYTKTLKVVTLNEDINFLNKKKIDLLKDKRNKNQVALVEYIEKNGATALKVLTGEKGFSASTIKTLEKKHIVYIKDIEELRDTTCSRDINKEDPVLLNEEQLIAFNFIKNELSLENKKPILLKGITGSGKTEVYLRTIKEVIDSGKQAIVLVPEISLTPQTVERFVERFGDLVTVTHSRMNYGERFDQWKKARTGQVSVMIGPRSALFTPFANLGAIIIDEEHESSYKSDTTPKYHAREIAEKLAQITGALVIYGSATPDLTTYTRAINNEMHLLKLTKKARSLYSPEVIIKDMRAELEKGNLSIFSDELYEAIEENLKNKQQTMLYINRRGYSTFVSCRQCGHVMMCDNCNVSYTYHSYDKRLYCHYCGRNIPNPSVCPKCGSKYIKHFGTGTEKVQSIINKHFPDARVLRMDLDTTQKKNSYENIITSFRNHEADILIGTQMIAKGHDFPKVSLVGIIAADLSLNLGDFKSTETTFQHITQMAGRAGRADLKGKVIIQTYNPDNYSIVTASNEDYEGFYNEEMKIRQLMNYPPFSNIATVLLVGKNEAKIIDTANMLGSFFKKYNRQNRYTVLGPAPANISKIQNEYRWRFIIKGENEEYLRNYIIYCIRKLEEVKSRDVLINITLNPMMIV